MDRWDFNRFVEEVIHLSEIAEVPGIAEARDKLIWEMWKRFPAECRAMGLTDGACYYVEYIRRPSLGDSA